MLCAHFGQPKVVMLGSMCLILSSLALQLLAEASALGSCRHSSAMVCFAILWQDLVGQCREM